MGAYNRYLFCKKKYPDYLVFVVVKGKMVTFEYDLKIVEMFKDIDKLNINYIILNGLEIKLFKSEINNYFYYFEICLLKDILEYIYRKMQVI